MFQVDPIIETILLKTHHNSVRSLLLVLFIQGKITAQLGQVSVRLGGTAHPPQLSFLTLQWLPLTEGKSPRPHTDLYLFA